MNKMINMRNSVIVILCITIIFMAIGFIVTSTNYTKNSKDISYDVSFTNIKKLSSVKGSNKEPSAKVKINDNSSIIEMNVTMNSPHDELSYIATIENNGNVPIEIVDVIESPDYNMNSLKNLINPVSITLSDIEGRIIKPNEELDLKIVFYYNSENKGTKTFDYKIGLITKAK